MSPSAELAARLVDEAKAQGLGSYLREALSKLSPFDLVEVTRAVIKIQEEQP